MANSDFFYPASTFYQSKFGSKVYKIALDADCTCPTRDGTKGTRGCIFCSETGSGDFSIKFSDSIQSIDQAINQAKSLVNKKLFGRNSNNKKNVKYIAYFQNHTNTYGNALKFNRIWTAALSIPDVVGITIATRPDCLKQDVLEVIANLAKKTFVSIELGLQTVNPSTVEYIRRNYEFSDYVNAISQLRNTNPNIHITTHVIFGLPGDTQTDMLETIKVCAGNSLLYPVQRVDGIKISLLHVLQGTDLEQDWLLGKVKILEKDEYFNLLSEAICLLPPDMVIHRLTGDGPKKILLAPLWTSDKKTVYNSMLKYFSLYNIHQGSKYINPTLT